MPRKALQLPQLLWPAYLVLHAMRVSSDNFYSKAITYRQLPLTRISRPLEELNTPRHPQSASASGGLNEKGPADRGGAPGLKRRVCGVLAGERENCSAQNVNGRLSRQASPTPARPPGQLGRSCLPKKNKKAPAWQFTGALFSSRAEQTGPRRGCYRTAKFIPSRRLRQATGS